MPHKGTSLYYDRLNSLMWQNWLGQSQLCLQMCWASSIQENIWDFPGVLWGSRGHPSPPCSLQKWHPFLFSPTSNQGNILERQCPHRTLQAHGLFLRYLQIRARLIQPRNRVLSQTVSTGLTLKPIWEILIDFSLFMHYLTARWQ